MASFKKVYKEIKENYGHDEILMSKLKDLKKAHKKEVKQEADKAKQEQRRQICRKTGSMKTCKGF